MTIQVTGQDCLNYIDRDTGFASLVDPRGSQLNDQTYWQKAHATYIELSSNLNATLASSLDVYTNILRAPKHGRIVGYVSKHYDDGGIEISLMGNGKIIPSELSSIALRSFFVGEGQYDHGLVEPGFTLNGVISSFPFYTSDYSVENITETKGGCFNFTNEHGEEFISFDDVIEFTPSYYTTGKRFTRLWRLDNVDGYDADIPFEIDLDTTTDHVKFGVGIDYYSLYTDEMFIGDPLAVVSGDLYAFLTDMNFEFSKYLPKRVPDDVFPHFVGTSGVECLTWNLSSIPYNIILTDNLQFAREYVNNGTLPPDAYLYPLDWNNFPQYEPSAPTGDEPEDYDDDNTPDDDTRDFDPMPPENPTFTVNQLSNYNWYWLDVTQWSGFINWFWNDIGNYNDFDDIIAKVKGLYNDLASSVIMCRYYPVDVSWIGGTGTQSNIKLGMIEKAGVVDTLANTALRVQDIGHVHIGGKYKSFMDMSPYSQLSLYLPWHGFIDIDVNLFTGHDLYVKALYDYMSGTIQYYIYYDNEVPVNTILCKMAMDIPITLQTKNDRDSAIFNNVSSTIGGLVGAGVGIASGNPIGMVMGVTQGIGAINSSNASAPMRLMGNVGESGAYLGCQQCAIVVRRPTIQPSDGNSQTSIAKGLGTWKHNVGMLCGYGYVLDDLKGQGFTVCHTPRIDFKNTAPMQSEVDEIYSYLEKGVIL